MHVHRSKVGMVPVRYCACTSIGFGSIQDICRNRPNVVNNLSCEEIISGLKEANVDIIFSIANSNSNTNLYSTKVVYHHLNFMFIFSMYSLLSYFYPLLLYTLCIRSTLYADTLWVMQYMNF